MHLLRHVHVPHPWQVNALDSSDHALTAARAALEKHAEDVQVIDVRGLSSVTDFFVICTAASSRQVDALKEHIEAALAARGCSVWHTEGTMVSARSAPSGVGALQWILMDCGPVVVHLFDQPTRDFYRLEDLWADAPRIALAAPAG